MDSQAPRSATLGFLREVQNRSAAAVRVELQLSSGWATLMASLGAGETWQAALWIPRGASVRTTSLADDAAQRVFERVEDFAVVVVT